MRNSFHAFIILDNSSSKNKRRKPGTQDQIYAIRRREFRKRNQRIAREVFMRTDERTTKKSRDWPIYYNGTGGFGEGETGSLFVAGWTE